LVFLANVNQLPGGDVDVAEAVDEEECCVLDWVIKVRRKIAG